MTIIPAIDIIDGKCVRLTQGDYNQKKVYNEHPLEVAKAFEDAGLKRLHLVDLDGAKAKAVKNWKVLELLASKTQLVIDFGGGITAEKDLKIVFESGAAFATIGSIAVKDEKLFESWILKFGPDKFLLGADVKDKKISVHGWLEQTDIGILDFIKKNVERRLENIFCTDISKDGKLEGPSIDLYREILESFPSINFIASGGVSSVDDLKKLEEIGCSAAIVGKAIYEGRISLNELKKFFLKTVNGTKRIIPCLDIKDGRTVKGTNFVELRDAGDPVELAALYAKEGADELVFLDITATIERRKTLVELVTRVAKQINIPFTVGGGIVSVEDVKLLVSKGADKVSINSAAVRNPDLINDIAGEFGNQCVVLAIDTKQEEDGEWYVYLNGGRLRTEYKCLEWAREGVDRGAGEILLTSMNHDGTKSGFALDITGTLSAELSVPVIASGGGGTKQHFADVFKIAKADAALAASIFHFKEIPIPELKSYLAEQEISIRK